MEHKPNSEKYKRLEKSIKDESSNETLTPETMLMGYPALEKVKDGYKGDFSDFPNFSNWNNWPHSR